MSTKHFKIITFLLILISHSASSQTLFTYGTKSVTKDEFLKAFNKNPDTTGSRTEKIKEYLDMYINFKIKLQAAYDEKLNNDDVLKHEADNFKLQLAENIINEQANINELVDEAFLRSQKDIRLSQVFVEIHGNSDTTTAFEQINKAYADLNNGKSFDEVAVMYSSDSSVKALKGNVGYITVFTLPYAIENIVYNLQPGKYANIYRSTIGYHIFKNEEERPAMGRRKIEQLIFPMPSFFTESEKQAVAKRSDSVYNLLKQGTSFTEMVKAFGNAESENNTPVEVSVGEYSSNFEEQVFALKSHGEISRPFVTDFGYNIIKLAEIIPVTKDEKDVINSAYLQEHVQSDNRLNLALNKLTDKWLTLIKYKPLAYILSDLWSYTDSVSEGNQMAKGYKTIKPNTVLFEFNKEKITAADWGRFVSMKKNSDDSSGKAAYSNLMQDFIHKSADTYYRNHIEDFVPSVSEQMKEFNDANLLFSIMDKQIWNKASEDSAGLKKYFELNKQKYTWTSSVTALVVSGTNEKIINEAANKIKDSSANWRNIISRYGIDITADSTRFEADQLPVQQKIIMQAGFQTAPENNNSGQTYSFIHVFQVFPQSSQRTFEEARGMVMNDYQQVLEQKWLDELKKKYPLKVNEAVLKTIE